MSGLHTPLGRIAALALLLSSGLAGVAEAQSVDDSLITPSLPLEFDRGRNTSVVQRERPEYQAVGIPVRSFILYPRIETSIGATNNAYQSPVNGTGDGFAILTPSFALNSDWSVHELDVRGSVRLKRFFDETPRNEDNYSLDVSGRLDATRTATIQTFARIAQSTEPRASAASPQDAANAVQYRQITLGIVPRFAGAKVRGQLAFNVDRLRFDDVTTFAGNRLDQSNRDQTVIRGTARGEYALSPDTSLFAQVGYVDTRYEQALAPGIANRDSHEYDVLGGATFDLSALVRGAVGIGYVRRTYQAPIYRDISGLAAEAKIEYFPTQLTTVSLTASRSIHDSAFFNSSGYFATAFAARVDHELLRNLLLNAQAAYETDKFAGDVGTVKIFRLSTGARYLVTRTFGLGFLVGRDERSGSGIVGGTSFNENRGLVSVVFQR